MPARAESLRITERYRGRMVRLRNQGMREAKRVWNHVDPANIDGTFAVANLELTVKTLQREAARLSSAYLASFIASELGEPEHPPPLEVWDKTFQGDDLRNGLRSAVIKAKTQIGDGVEPRLAVNNARVVLTNNVGLYIDTATRESLRKGMEADDRIVAAQRAVKGTCGACLGDTTYQAFSENAPVEPLEVHPNCQCVAEPVVEPLPANKAPLSRIDTQTGARRGFYGEFTEADYQAVRNYVGQYSSMDLNNLLRYGDDWRDIAKPLGQPQLSNSELRALQSNLDTAFGHAKPLGSAVRVYRGVRWTPDELGMEAEKVFTDPAFSSTSSSRAVAQSGALRGEGNTTLEMNVSPKVRGIWGANDQEGELLLERGCRYVVRSVRKGQSRWFVEIDVLPPK